jgi:5-methylcytosine-specific restriction enzyme B
LSFKQFWVSMEKLILDELRVLASSQAASGLVEQPEIDRQTALFQDRFGPAVLASLKGEALLRVMHGRRAEEPRALVYWLEYKNDDEFSCGLFGGVGGGGALKFGLLDKQPENLWFSGSAVAKRHVSEEEAVRIAETHRAELTAGSDVLAALRGSGNSDEVYESLDRDMRIAAPSLCDAGWAHKYWFLVHPDLLDTFHSPSYQRFHLLKLLEMPPDQTGVVRNVGASRFVCAGRFVEGARQVGVSITLFDKLLGKRNPYHKYWKVGTTAGSEGVSYWPDMRDGGHASIGWGNVVPDLTETLRLKEAEQKSIVTSWLGALYPAIGVAKRKAGEILNFAAIVAQGDLVLACEGDTVLGVGRVAGPYAYDPTLKFPHTRPVEWLLLDSWQMPVTEGPRTTVYPFGKNAANVLELERRLAGRSVPSISDVKEKVIPITPATVLPADPFTIRVEAMLKRKGQVIFYGPPGTGKTYRALQVAKELAARKAFRKSFSELTAEDQKQVSGPTGLTRLCTFHPNLGYEEFIEGLRAEATEGAIAFNIRKGVFASLCADAIADPARDYFLIIDEINRGDIPRIFGELMSIIEIDKRLQEIVLPVSGDAFYVPRNVFIIGTMNTADRSISLLDAALRRRFSFVELMPDSGCLSGKVVGDLQLGSWLDALNKRLRKSLKRDARNLQIGHSYLMSPISSISEFSAIVRDDIIPLIEDYCYDDIDTLQEILGKDLVDVSNARIKTEIFEPSREDDLIQALRFEEMGSSTIEDVAEQNASSGMDEPDDSEDDITDSAA